jgi:hypothetical protein
MTHFRFIPLIVALSATGSLIACGTTPAMPMGTAAASSMPTPDAMTRMDEQMQTMRVMHEKMMSAKTPEERSKLMADHMNAMQAGMSMMKGMSGMGGPMAGTGAMGAMGAMGVMGADANPKGMPADMAKHDQMMAKRMDMMQMMMEMMMDRMPPSPVGK